MWFISFSRAVTVENCHNSTIVLGVTKTAVNVIGCDSCSFFAVCDRVSIRFVLIPSHGSTQLAKCAQLLLWNIVESLRSENDNEDDYEFCPREVCYFVFALVLVSTQFVSFDWKKKKQKKTGSRSSPWFFTCFQGKNSCYDRKNAVWGWHTWWRRRLNDFSRVGRT